MDDDVNPTIRPVLPSRQNTQPPSGAVLGLNQMCPICGGAHTQAEHGHPLPPEPKKEKTVKKAKPYTTAFQVRKARGEVGKLKKDPRRSAAAKAIWARRKAEGKRAMGMEVRRQQARGLPPENALANAIVALLKLKPAQQDLAVQIARSVVL